jgi:hypothetical protein
MERDKKYIKDKNITKKDRKKKFSKVYGYKQKRKIN